MSNILFGTGAVIMRSDDGYVAVLPAPVVVGKILRATVHVVPASAGAVIPVDDPRWSPRWSLTAPDGHEAPSLGGGAGGGPTVMSIEREFSLDALQLDGEWKLRILDRTGRFDMEARVVMDWNRGTVVVLS